MKVVQSITGYSQKTINLMNELGNMSEEEFSNAITNFKSMYEWAICQRFLAKHQLKYCSRCAKKQHLEDCNRWYHKQKEYVVKVGD